MTSLSRCATGAVVCASLLLLVACTTTGGVKSATDASRVVGCGSPEAPSDATPKYVTDQVECEIDEEKVRIYYFANAADETAFLSEAVASGTKYLAIDTFLISGPADLLPKLQTAIGGQLRP